MTASRRNSHKPCTGNITGTGWFRSCSRCAANSDEVNTSYRLIQGCALVRGDWLCSFCYDTHRDGCPVCRLARTR